uniref:Uncharacterized protein n=1 Tax=Candidatus Kentrum sp. FM TaxID=2126340 RepID=A0A450VX82_9GAMM|nr:MAG: hypothetical protein BECKFM1743A_GA0114220_101056 [Candidatus Kentron sp. FM]VFK09380.1 MAG: hypothetical protein BECKFM1743B_GA0114221_101038 [Candidatus Kentron sp. FM]
MDCPGVRARTDKTIFLLGERCTVPTDGSVITTKGISAAWPQPVVVVLSLSLLAIEKAR